MYTGSGLHVSKIRRLSQPDDKLGDGIDYTYVEDKSKFVADNATLRYASISVFLDSIIIVICYAHGSKSKTWYNKKTLEQ